MDSLKSLGEFMVSTQAISHRTTTSLSEILIAIDLGSSLFKVIHTGRHGKPEAIAIRPEISFATEAQVEAQISEYHDDPLRSAVVEVDGKLYAAGDFATDLSGRQYHELSKWENLTPRLLSIIGLVCHRLGFPNGFSVTIGLLLPRDEVNPPGRESKLEAIKQAAANFKFRGSHMQCQLSFKIATEGAGLFAAHAAHLQAEGISPIKVDIPVIMAGERNTSLLVYRAGKLNPALSASDGDGFYKFAQQLRKAVGGTVPLPDLIQAVAQKRDRIRVQGAEVVDIAPHLSEVLDAYYNSMIGYLKAKLPANEINVICGGGAFNLIWNRLENWFESLFIPAVYVGDPLVNELRQIFQSGVDMNTTEAQIIRFADALGLYKALTERMRREMQGKGFSTSEARR
jgi:hypothetical protein